MFNYGFVTDVVKSKKKTFGDIFWLSYRNKNYETLISGKKLVNLGSPDYLKFVGNTAVYGSVDNISEYIVE